MVWGLIPGDFVTKVKQINSQSDLISMSSFAGPVLPHNQSSVYIILIRHPCMFNLYNVHQTRSYCILGKLHQCALHFNEEITRTNLLQLQPSFRPVPALKLPVSILLWKEPSKLCIECHLVPL